jgi:hypothetical protein
MASDVKAWSVSETKKPKRPKRDIPNNSRTKRYGSNAGMGAIRVMKVPPAGVAAELPVRPWRIAFGACTGPNAIAAKKKETVLFYLIQREKDVPFRRFPL